MTIADLIRRSLSLLGVIAEGETPTAQMQTDALSTLNDMLDSWSAESLMVHARVREEFTLTASQQSYTMGTGGDFNTTRPVEIEAASCELQGGTDDTETPVQVLTLEEWARIEDKGVTSNIVTKIWADWSHTLVNIHCWPIPSAANKLVLYSWKALSTVAVTDTFSMPQGYAKAVRYNLAVEMAPEYDMEPTPTIVGKASESIAVIKRRNSRPKIMGVDRALLGGRKQFDYRTGE